MDISEKDEIEADFITCQSSILSLLVSTRKIDDSQQFIPDIELENYSIDLR